MVLVSEFLWWLREERGTESCRIGNIKHPYVPEQSRTLHETASQLSLKTTAVCQTLCQVLGWLKSKRDPDPVLLKLTARGRYCKVIVNSLPSKECAVL